MSSLICIKLCINQRNHKTGAKNCQKSRRAKKGQKRWKKGLPNGTGCGIILERQGPPERMTSERRRKRKGRTNVRTLKSEITSSQKPKSFWKKCLTKNRFCDKIIKLSAERLRRTGPWKLNNIEKLERNLFSCWKNTVNNSKSNSHRTQAIAYWAKKI